jgi:hypothetical protein
MSRDMETRTARIVVAAAGRVLKNAAIANARANGSVLSGVMIKNIVFKHERKTSAGTAQVNLGVRHGAKGQSKKQRAVNKRLRVVGGRVMVEYINNPYYFRWVERGHRIVSRAKSGEESFTVSTYQQHLRNGKVITRTKKRSTAGLRARRAAATVDVPAKPFLEPALRDNQQAVIDAMSQRLAKELQKLGIT